MLWYDVMLLLFFNLFFVILIWCMMVYLSMHKGNKGKRYVQIYLC